MEQNASRPPSWMSLRTRLRLLMLVLLLPGLAYILTTSILERQRVRAEAQAQLSGLARLAAAEDQQTLRALQIQLALAASLDSVQAAARGGAPQACDAQLQAAAAGLPAPDVIVVWDQSGRPVCGAATVPVENAASQGWFQRTLASQAFALGEFQLDASRGVSTLTFGFPIIDSQQKPLGAVSASLDLGQLAPGLAGTLLPADTVISVFDQNGLVLARSTDAAQRVGQRLPGAAQLSAALSNGANVLDQPDVDGVARLIAFAPILGPGGQLVYLGLGRPTAAVYGPLDRALLIGLAITAALTLAALWLAARWSQQALERPIQAVLAVTTRLAQGDLAARAATETAGSEIDRLAQQVNTVAAALENAERLRQQSAERQRALETQLRLSQARTTQLETVAAGLSKAATAAEVMEVILRQGASAFGAASATLLLLTEHDRWLKRSAHAGQPDLIDMLFPRFPASSPLPAADVVRTGEAMWLQSAAEYRARYPQLLEVINSTDYEAAVAVPLRLAGQLIGVMMLSFPGELPANGETAAYLASLGSLCALGLERVGLKDLML